MPYSPNKDNKKNENNNKKNNGNKKNHNKKRKSIFKNDNLQNIIMRKKIVSDVDGMKRDTRLPVILLIDTSNSMSGHEDSLKAAVQTIYEKINKDKAAANAVELGILTFSDIIDIQVDIHEITRQTDMGKSLKFHTHGSTLTGLALKAALDMIEERKQRYKDSKSGIQCYAPILFIITDGDSYSSDPAITIENGKMLDESISEIKYKVSKNQLVVICFEIGSGTKHDNIVEMVGTDKSNRIFDFTSKNRKMTQEDIAKVFNITASMITSSSQGNKDVDETLEYIHNSMK